MRSNPIESRFVIGGQRRRADRAHAGGGGCCRPPECPALRVFFRAPSNGAVPGTPCWNGESIDDCPPLTHMTDDVSLDGRIVNDPNLGLGVASNSAVPELGAAPYEVVAPRR